MDGRFEVVPYRPLRRTMLTASLVCLLAGGGAVGYLFGAGAIGFDAGWQVTPAACHELVEIRTGELSRELVEVRLLQSVDSQTARELQETLSGARKELAGLREEVAFYKGLMAPGNAEQGLRIAEFDLVPEAADQVFRYNILLTQGAARRNWLEGNVDVQIRGHRVAADGSMAEEVLPLTVLSEGDMYPLRFRFRYFQDLVGTITLPEGFVPRSVLITAKPGAKGARDVSRSFDWVVQTG